MKIRKNFQLDPDLVAKLKRLAKKWRCSEAEVVRRLLVEVRG